MKRIFGIYNYIEWVVVLGLIYIMVYIWTLDLLLMISVLISLCIIAILCFIKSVIHDLNGFNSKKLWKYHNSFYVDSFSIGDKTYYIPVINTLTTWGNFHEFVISRSGEIGSRTPSGIKKIINKNASEVNRFIGNSIFTSEEEALYAITQIQNKISKVLQTKNQINNNKRTKVNFNNK